MNKVLKNRYEIIRKIGQGGAGCVYLAYDRHLRQKVAVKMWSYATFGMNSAHSCWGDENSGGLHEVDVLKNMQHKAFPVVYDLFREAEYEFMVMEYVQGINLADFIRDNGPLNQKQALVLMKKLISARLRAF